MNRFSYTPLPADGARVNMFERRHRQQGGSSRSYSEQVSTPSNVIERRKRLIILTALTVALPPVGAYCLWRGGYLNLPLRIGATAVAFALLTLYFLWMMPADTPEKYQPNKYRPGAVTEYSPSSQTSEAQDGGASNAQ